MIATPVGRSLEQRDRGVAELRSRPRRVAGSASSASRRNRSPLRARCSSDAIRLVLHGRDERPVRAPTSAIDRWPAFPLAAGGASAGVAVLIESAWIVPSSIRGLTAARTSRCWSIREQALELRRDRRSRAGGRRRPRRRRSTSAPGSAAAIIRSSSARSAISRSFLAASSISSKAVSLIRGRPAPAPRSCSRRVDRLPAVELDEVDAALGRAASARRVGLEPSRSGSFPAAASSSSVSIVSWASFLFVPMTPLGPRLIQPTT